MANVYRINILGYEPAPWSSSINFDVSMEMRVSANPDVWQPVSNGHRTIVMPINDFNTATATGTSAQKRQAVRAQLKELALNLGVDAADEAYLALTDLLPPPFDVVIRE